MKQKRKSVSVEELTLPTGARQSLASFGVTDESDQDDFFLELADGLRQVADAERELGLRPKDAEHS